MVPAVSTQKDRVMITIANCIANLFVFGLGLLFLGGGLTIIIGIVFRIKDIYDRR